MTPLTVLALSCALAFAAPRRECDAAQPQGELSMASGRPSGAPGEPAVMWERLRGAYQAYLSSVTEDAVGREAAAFLRRSTVALEAGDLQSRLGEDVFAAYDAASRVIQLDRRGLSEVKLSLQSAELQPERATPFVERTAPAVVHEIRHAIDHEALGEAPLFVESELAAYADQAMFLWRRLEREPGYRGLRAVDEAVGGRLDPSAALGARERWWTRPLPARRIERLKLDVAEARRDLRELTSQETNDWFLARAWAGGVDRFREALARAGYLPAVSVLSPPSNAAASSRRELEHVWRQLAVLRSSKLPPQEKQRRARALEAELEIAERAAAFWGDPERRRKAGDYATRALEARRKDWEAMHGRHAGR